MTKTWKQMMIDTIRSRQHYETGSLEKMTEAEVQEIYNRLIDWIG